MASNKPCFKGIYLEYRGTKCHGHGGNVPVKFWEGKSILCNIGVSK